MSNKDNGGPAFPCQYQGDTHSDASGLSMRDYFAAKALMGMLSNEECNPFHQFDFNAKVWSKKSYELADAMLEARKQ